MPKKHTFQFSHGFIDPLSLIAVSFLLVTAVVGTFVVNKKGISFNPNENAMIMNEEGTSTNTATTPTPVPTTTTSIPTPATPSPTTTQSTCAGTCYHANSCSSLGRTSKSGNCIKEDYVCCGAIIPTAPPTPTPIPTQNVSLSACKVCSGTSCITKSGSCDSDKNECEVNSECTVPCSGECVYGIPCSQANRETSPGSCTNGAYCCGKAIPTDNCTQGLTYCIDSHNVGVCKDDKSGYTSTPCSAGTTCYFDQKMCKPTTTEAQQQANAASCLDPCDPNDSNSCAANEYCYKPAGGCPFCKPKGTICTAGVDKRCSATILETCNSTGTGWASTINCGSLGCNNTKLECNLPQPTPTTSAGTMWSGYQYTPPAVSEEFTKGTQACLNDPKSVECKNWNEQLLKEGAIVGAALAAIPLAAPGAATTAYFGVTSYLSTLPSWVGTALSVSEVAGTGYATYKCFTDPLSQECVALTAIASGNPAAFIEGTVSSLNNISQTLLKPYVKVGASNSTLLPTKPSASVQNIYNVDQDSAANVVDDFVTNGGFDNPRLKLPTQGRNSQTAFFTDQFGEVYVIKREAQNAIDANWQANIIRGDTAFLESGAKNNVAATTFVNKNNVTYAVQKYVDGKLMNNPADPMLKQIINEAKQNGVIMNDWLGNVIVDANGNYVVIDTGRAISASTNPELIYEMLTGIELPPSRTGPSFFDEFR